MAFGFAGIVELLLAPPGLSIWLILAGVWLLYRRRSRLGLGLAGSGLVLLYLFSTPLVAQLLLSGLQASPVILPAELDERDAQAIVVLGAGRREDAAEYGIDTPNSLALERLRYAAWIARRTDLPVLVSGGLARDGRPPEAMLMMEVTGWNPTAAPPMKMPATAARSCKLQKSSGPFWSVMPGTCRGRCGRLRNSVWT